MITDLSIDNVMKNMNNGWNIINKQSKIESLVSQIQFDIRNNYINEENLKLEIAKNFIYELLKYDLIEFSTESDLNREIKILRGEIFISKGKKSYLNLVDKIFKVGDNEFTNDELVEAVKYKFAERFI